MSQYLAPPGDQFLADLARLFDRVTTAETQIAQGAGLYAAFPCTSSTRPATPRVGQQIIETDTGATAVWSGTGWLYQPGQIATQTLVGTAASVTFPAIPAYTTLSLTWRARLSAAGSTDMHMQIDGNTGNNYLWSKIEASNGASNAAHAAGAVAFINVGVISGDTASYMGSGQQTLAGWASGTGFLTTSGTYVNFSTTTVDWSGTAGGQFNVAGPHTSIKLVPAAGSFAAGSQFVLYGLM